jgi:MFS family permease
LLGHDLPSSRYRDTAGERNWPPRAQPVFPPPRVLIRDNGGAIHRDLGSSLAGPEWTVNACTLSFAVLLMTAAAIGDRLGRRRVFAAGLALFAVSSAACALAARIDR